MKVSHILNTVLGSNIKMPKTVKQLIGLNPYFYEGLEVEGKEDSFQNRRVNLLNRAQASLSERNFRLSKIVYYGLWAVAVVFAAISFGVSFYINGPVTVASWMVVPFCVGAIIGAYKAIRSKEPMLLEKLKAKSNLFACYTKKGKAEYFLVEAVQRVIQIAIFAVLLFFNIIGWWILSSYPTYYLAKTMSFHYFRYMKGSIA